MKIFVNDQAVEIFSGATVRDAVTQFKKKAGIGKTINAEDIRDHRGNSLSPAGELSEEDRLYIKECNHEDRG